METREAKARRLRFNRLGFCAGLVGWSLVHLLMHYRWLNFSVGVPIAVTFLFAGVFFGLRGYR